jgi:hypothetical protein
MRKLFRDGICWGAAMVFAIVAVPLIAIAAIVLRPVLMLAAVVAGVSMAVLYCVSSRFRGWVGRHLVGYENVPVTVRWRH